MNIGIILFVLSMFLFLYSGASLYKQYKDSSGVFFLYFSIGLLLWIIVASAAFDPSFGEKELIFLNQLSYWLSTTFFISFILFFTLFKSGKKQVYHSFIGFSIFALVLLYLYIGTDFIIKDVKMTTESGVYEEVYGPLFVCLQFFYAIIPFLLGFFAYLSIKKQDYITKIRLIFIALGFTVTSSIAILFLVILPLLHIYSYEGEIIYFFIPFLFGIIYSSKTYVFSSFHGILRRFFLFFTSVIFALIGVNLVEKFSFLLGLSKNIAANPIIINYNRGFTEIILYSLLFITISSYIAKRNKMGNYFLTSLNEIQKQVPFSTTLNDLNFLLETEFWKKFGIKHVKINLFKDFTIGENNLYTFFSYKKTRKFFLNEKVFLKENFKNPEIFLQLQKIDKNDYLIIPLRKKDILVGYISFGKKSFERFYSREEVDMIEKFVFFLEGHLKYIDIYSEIHDLNLNLEKRVDEKTMQYNAIINRQKEFIEVVSHEVRTPLATALFQTECLEYELKELVFPKKRKMIGDVKALYNKIVDTVSLVNKLFSIERFESNKITLYRENTDIGNMLRTQVQPYIKSHKEIDFHYEQAKNVGYLDIDIVQFKQVIDNLITNAIKFSTKVQHPKISIKLVKKKNDIVFTIEDSGLGFSGIDISSLFEKYNTGDSSSIGLGMGLYLCKKIVELHGGNISAWKSKLLGGALFKIVIPKN